MRDMREVFRADVIDAVADHDRPGRERDIVAESLSQALAVDLLREEERRIAVFTPLFRGLAEENDIVAVGMALLKVTCGALHRKLKARLAAVGPGAFAGHATATRRVCDAALAAMMEASVRKKLASLRRGSCAMRAVCNVQGARYRCDGGCGWRYVCTCLCLCRLWISVITL